MPFNQPVNLAVYTLYLDYVPNPMDFSTVRPRMVCWPPCSRTSLGQMRII